MSDNDYCTKRNGICGCAQDECRYDTPCPTTKQGDDVVERLKDAADRMLNGEVIGRNLSIFATDIKTVLNRATNHPDHVVLKRGEVENIQRAFSSCLDELWDDWQSHNSRETFDIYFEWELKALSILTRALKGGV